MSQRSGFSASRTSQVTFTLGLRQGKSTTKLGEDPLKKGEWNSGEGASFTARLDRLFLSPSGQRAVVLGAFLSEDGQLALDPRVIVAVVDLPAKP